MKDDFKHQKNNIFFLKKVTKENLTNVIQGQKKDLSFIIF